MLKIGKLAMLLVLLVSFGCEKEPTTQSNEENIVAKWNLVRVWSDNYKTTTTFDGETTISTSTLEGKDISYNYDFKDDNTVIAGGSYTAVLTTTSQGTTIEQEVPGINYSGNGTWSIDGDKLTVQEDGKDPQTAKIISLTDSELKLAVEFDISHTVQGATSTTTGTIHFEYTK